MTTLAEQIAAYKATFKDRVPDNVRAIMLRATEELKQSGIEARVCKTGDTAPEFMLRNHRGEERSLPGLLLRGPLVLSFYRGGWCPYCNLELAALQRALPEMEALGAQLVAVSPETPDHSLSTIEKNMLRFDVLHDQGNMVAERYGLVFSLHEALRPIYAGFGIRIAEANGDDTFTLPIPATYVINRDGRIMYHFADADYTTRLEPAQIINALKLL